MPMDILAIRTSPEAVAAHTGSIHATILKESNDIRQPNFTAIGTTDLYRLFELYDQMFFESWLGKTVIEKTGLALRFRLSPTMTRAGGKTITYRMHDEMRFEIAIASRMLFMTFRDIARPVTVCGLLCADRLQALQRIMEHEIIHLAELLAWGESSCSAPRFQSMARNIFGHVNHRHELVTPREHAAKVHAIQIGQKVEFEFEGTRHVGTVNRIHRRATVLVESENGMRYTNGKNYLKFYVPLRDLRAVT